MLILSPVILALLSLSLMATLGHPVMAVCLLPLCFLVHDVSLCAWQLTVCVAAHCVCGSSLENSRCLLYGECKLQFGYPRCLSFASMMDEALGTVKGKWMAKKSLGPFSVWAKTDVTGGIQVGGLVVGGLLVTVG